MTLRKPTAQEIQDAMSVAPAEWQASANDRVGKGEADQAADRGSCEGPMHDAPLHKLLSFQ